MMRAKRPLREGGATPSSDNHHHRPVALFERVDLTHNGDTVSRPMDAPQEAALAAAIEATLRRFDGSLGFKRLRVRVRELGENQRDEVAQFKQL